MTQSQLFAWGKAAVPARTQINHGLISAAAGAAVVLAGVAAIQLYGDPKDAGPRVLAPVDPAGVSVDAAALRAPLSEVIVPPDADLPPPLPVPEDPSLAPLAAARPGKPAASPLPPAPIRGLSAPGPKGPLPVIRADGVTPAQAYKRPAAAGEGPRVALVVSGLGFSAGVTEQAIERLPPEVTLSFVPYASDLQGWIDRARAAGHEVLIEVPMEPFDAEAVDTGPQTLLAAAPAAENIGRLEDLLSRATGYFGVTNYQGGRFAASREASAPVVSAVKSRGLALIGNGLSARSALSAEAGAAGLPFTGSDRLLDVRRDADSIADQLAALEAQAREGGMALGAGFAYPVTIAQIERWSAGLAERGLVLTPASDVAERRSRRR